MHLKRTTLKESFAFGSMLLAFIIWTIVVYFADIRTIGPKNSAVGLATINEWVHGLTGVHMSLYTITDWLSLIPLGFVLGFAFYGILQWIQRKSLLKVDRSILVLGGFYIVVFFAYFFFEFFVVNYRPVLIDGILEASYPSSTTLLVLCVMSTALMQLNTRIKNGTIKRLVSSAIVLFIIFMVVGRLISGVHWVTDIIGGILLSASLIILYHLVSESVTKKWA